MFFARPLAIGRQRIPAPGGPAFEPARSSPETPGCTRKIEYEGGSPRQTLHHLLKTLSLDERVQWEGAWISDAGPRTSDLRLQTSARSAMTKPASDAGHEADGSSI